MVQTNGLAGHEHDFYKYISDSDWTGGSSFYSNLEEAGSYWFNGMVPNAVLSGDPTLQSRVQYFLDYVLDHQDSTGWIGPEVLDSSKPRYLWGRYPFLLGAIQMVEADPTQADKIVDALHRFVTLSDSMLQKNGTGLEEWGKARWMEFVITLQWLYDFYPNGREEELLNMMKTLKATGDSWEAIFAPENFPTTATEGMNSPISSIAWHGVNVAEALKAFPASYRFTKNQSDIDAASAAWDILFKYHGRPSGVFGADEFLAGLEAIRGGSYMYQVIGDLKYADGVERMTYNALPATLTGDMWSRQYLQQQNQVAAKNMNPDPFPRDGAYSNVFGLEPNYPCCTVNHPQGWPKFISNAFVTTADKTSLVHVYLGPYSVNTTLANDNKVAVSVDTIYPFSDSLITTITADKPFTYYVRIPSWASNGTIAINGEEPCAVQPTDGLQSIPVQAGSTNFTLNLPAEITVEARPRSSIAVHRGPLHYALDIQRSQKVLSQNANESLAVDLEFDATAPWEYAIDPCTLVFHANPPANGTIPSPIFDFGLSPYTITATACPITWGLAGDTFAMSPPENPACTGAPVNITLSPYGATKLRISEFPTFSVGA
ncbi:hypothetical protein GSI_12771 [Ganoderma sinense ZZ0214-1]|uniref:Non-reducing end beta-L-arabinofuranosidase-like GH127 middle domain-containing protein n=1 Tax=Ganoderma sinense ZZ0214-1 TaxID=1077348 RepID=A0A2G8RTT0_9APHY|nr:hypothetical protein GSI_12771 [Ganoderma sinense ZZ0214-1]